VLVAVTSTCRASRQRAYKSAARLTSTAPPYDGGLQELDIDHDALREAPDAGWGDSWGIEDDRLGQLIPGLIASRNVFEYSEEAYASGGGELLPLLVINVSGVGQE
jgi:hypothetical protein